MVASRGAIAAAAILSISIASATPISKWRRAEDPLGGSLPADLDRGVCVANDYSSEDSRKSVWESARGSEVLDAYLNQNDREGWTTEVYKKLFPEENANQIDCWSQEAHCTVNTHTCDDFDAQSAAGFYQVFVSVQNFHTFVAQYLENLQNMCNKGTMLVRPLVNQFGRAEGEEPEALDVGAILGGALSFGAGVGGNSPAAASILGGLSGITSIISAAAKDRGVPPSDELTEDGLWNMLSQTCTSSKDAILNILQGVTGAPDSSEADVPHEMKMQDGEGKGYVHAVSYLFGNGQWLLDHPTEGLAENFDKVEAQLKQGMAWQMVKVSHNVVMVINDDSPCTDVNEVRDDENTYCYGLMKMSDDWTNVEGGLNDVSAALWSTEGEGLGMDKLTTYRNALNCWKDNDAQVGAIEPNGDPMSAEIPKCFFGIEVKKGKWVDKESGVHRIALDDTFPNIHGEPGAGGYWPDCTLWESLNC